MAPDQPSDLTRLLADVNASRPGAFEALANAVYRELRDKAQHYLARGFDRNMAGASIQPTMLVDDTLMKLVKQRQKFDNSGHFFAIACIQMRRVLMDYYRARQAKKRGGGLNRITYDSSLDDRPASNSADGVDIEAFDRAIAKLRELDSRKAQVVEYRVLWGQSIEETAEALGVSRQTVERDWAFARAWLAKEISATS